MTLSSLIDKELLKEQEERSKRERSGKFNPSSFGRCYRYQIWNRDNQPQSNPPEVLSLRKFKAGKLFHDYAQSFIQKSWTEVRVERDDVLGFADVVCDEEKTVWDIKSQHSKAFWYMQKAVDITTEKEANILQVMSYVYFLGYEWGRLLFISKDDLCTQEYGFHINNWKERVENELKTIREWWGKYPKELPPALPRAYGGKECQYCPFKTKCEQVETGEKT